MTATLMRLARFSVDLSRPLADQAASLGAELAAAAVFVNAAEAAVLAGNVHEDGRLDALKTHIHQLRRRLMDLALTH